MCNKLNHFDSKGQAVMVDVSGKNPTQRTASAGGTIDMNQAAFEAVCSGGKKGDVLAVARIAGIMAAKQTSSLIPLCHPIALEKTGIEFTIHQDTLSIDAVCTVKTSGKTGVEMEALTGASIALLTIYDMCKAADRSMEIKNLRLLEKHGGKSGDYAAGDK